MPRFITLPLHILLIWCCIYALSFCVHCAAGQRNANNRERDEQRRLDKATEVLKYMNRAADPCNNFYDYACGRWQEYQPKLQEGDAPISVETQLVQSVRKDVQTLLDAATRTKGRPNLNERKVKEFYKSCLIVERASALQQAFLMNFVKEYHGMPLLAGTNWNINYDWVQVVALLRINYGFDFLIGMDVNNRATPTLAGRAVIFLTEPKTTLLPRHLCSAGAVVDVEERDAVSAQLQTEVSKDLQAWFTLKEDETERVAGDIIRFEFDLCRFMREEESVPPAPTAEEHKPERIVYEGRKLAYLSKQFGNIINFRKYLETSLNSSVDNLEIVMQSARYFHNLARLVRSNPKPTLTNYIIYRALSVINLPRNEARQPRAAYCAELVMRYFPKVIGEMYKNKQQRGEIKSDVEQLFGAMKEALREALNVELLPDNARNAFRNKLMVYETLMFPVYKGVNLRDLTLEQSNFWHKQDIAMKYKGYKERQRFYGGDPELDESIVEAPDIDMKLVDGGLLTGWGILQPPFYEYFYSNSLKYALIGQRLARALIDAVMPNASETEITHDDSVVEIFSNISECYRMQYSNYLRNIPNVFYNVTKLHQLMIDSAGLNVAFKAYLAWLESVDPSNRPILLRETLPDVDFTNTQLFFITFAQSRCYARYMAEPPPLFLPLDTHTEELYDVNGVLANNIEFAREFNCAPGTEMNPDDKCMLY